MKPGPVASGPEEPRPTSRTPVRRIVLVGFMGSGKSTVGRELARRLHWDFLDFDDVIREETGMTVEAIFRERGEAHFRALETDAGERLLRLRRCVLAPGGGWAARRGRLEALPDDTFTVWLRVSPETALRRIVGGPVADASGHPAAGAEREVRPLLAGPDALEEARRILAEREAFYRLARHRVDTEGADPGEIAAGILRHMEARSLLRDA